MFQTKFRFKIRVETKHRETPRGTETKKYETCRPKPLLVGDVVRSKISKGVIDKGSTPNWSESLFIIQDRIESDGKNTRYRLGGYEDGKPKKADELFLREDLQLIKYPTEIVKIPRVNFRKRKVEKAKKTRETRAIG